MCRDEIHIPAFPESSWGDETGSKPSPGCAAGAQNRAQRRDFQIRLRILKDISDGLTETDRETGMGQVKHEERVLQEKAAHQGWWKKS